MENEEKMNGNNTTNYPYNNEKISQADLGTSEVDVNDPRIISRKDAVEQDKQSMDKVDQCNMDNVVDESYRIDDNKNYSTTALEENPCIDAKLTPGVGIMYSELEEDMDKHPQDDKVYNNKKINITSSCDENRNK